MKKFIISVTTLILVSVAIFALAACDSTSGRSDTVSVTSFRDGNDIFVLPIKVSKANSGPEILRLFKSKMSLDEIYESISDGTDYNVSKGDGYILVTNASGTLTQYVYIAPYEGDRGTFNYLATNMGLLFTDPEADMPHLKILVPLPLIGVPASSAEVVSGNEYPLYGTIEEIKDFYTSCGYAVTETETGIDLTDVTGIKYIDGKVSYDDLLVNFTITFTEAGAVFSPQAANNNLQN